MARICGIIFLAAFVCVESGQLEDMEAKLSEVEANQKTLRNLLQELGQGHVQDMQNVTAMCQDLKRTVEERQGILEDLQKNMKQKPTTTPKPDIVSGPCDAANHTVLEDEWRSTSEEGGDVLHCDDELPHGWYRFMLDGCSAAIPTSCVEENHCQTHAPQWVDLQGQSLPEEGQEVHARACASWSNDCCNWESPITVRNCGHFYVYHLQPRETCHLAYCAEPQN